MSEEKVIEEIQPCPFLAMELVELEALPTLCVGQADSLKIESDYYRVWLSRCTVEDGEPYNNKVTVERLYNGIWKEYSIYQAL